MCVGVCVCELKQFARKAGACVYEHQVLSCISCRIRRRQESRVSRLRRQGVGGDRCIVRIQIRAPLPPLTEELLCARLMSNTGVCIHTKHFVMISFNYRASEVIKNAVV